SSQSRSVVGIIVRCIARATSVRGGGRPASIRSRSLAGSGRQRTNWASEGLNDRHYLGRTALPRPLTQRQRAGTQAPPQRCKKKLPCRIFPANRGSLRLGDRRCGDLTSRSWRISRTFAATICKTNAGDHAAALGVMGLLTKPSLRLSKMFAPSERSSAPSSPALILDQ